jgi:hypothetical protein
MQSINSNQTISEVDPHRSKVMTGSIQTSGRSSKIVSRAGERAARADQVTQRRWDLLGREEALMRASGTADQSGKTITAETDPPVRPFRTETRLQGGENLALKREKWSGTLGHRKTENRDTKDGVLAARYQGQK